MARFFDGWSWIFILIILVVSLVGGSRLDKVHSIKNQRVSSQNCAADINKYEDMGEYAINECEYILNQYGWPFSIRRSYEFTQIGPGNHDFVKNDVYEQDIEQWSEKVLNQSYRGLGPIDSNNTTALFVILFVMYLIPDIYLSARKKGNRVSSL